MENDQLIKSSGGIVVRKEGSIWHVALLYKNQGWFFPKGRIESGETEKQAALREIREELGIFPGKLRVLTKLGHMDYIAGQPNDNYILRPKTVSVFLIEAKQKKIRPLKKDGFQKAAWFSLKEALRIVPYPEMKSIFLKAINFLEKEEKARPEIRTVVVATGGKGERMGLKNFPKLLLPIQGKPFLGYLIDILISSEANFEQIYIFTHHYAEDIERFIEYNYASKEPKIKIVYTGAHTIPQQLYAAKNLPDQNFIYIDGNVIYRPSLFRDLIRQHCLSRSLITLAVSPKILAPTHLRIKIGADNRITESFSGLFTDPIIKQEKIFCGMGVLAINHYIFDLLPDLIYFYDLDLVINFLIKSKADFHITPYIYKKEWYCLHDRRDYKLMKTEGRPFFLELLKNEKQKPKRK